MENASQALLMAGGILITLLILAIGIMLYGTFNNSARGIVATTDSAELNKYNSSFMAYVGKKDVTAHDIVSLIGLSQQREQMIKIYVDDVKVETWNTNQINEFLDANIMVIIQDDAAAQHKENTFSYVDDSIKFDQHGRVCEIKFKKN